MSGYVLHLLVYGVCCAAAVFFLQGLGLPLPPLLCLAVGGFYALLPDVDAWNSTIRILLSGVFLVLFLLSKDILYGTLAAALGVFLAVSLFLGHRKFFHSLSAGFLLSLPLVFLDPCAAVFGFFGYLTHLILDGRVFRIS